MKFLTLKKSNCKNCYKCIRHCPVKAIRFSANQAHIVTEECILCGQCFVVCPQNAKEYLSEIEKVKMFIQSEEQVIVSLAPSFVANYHGVGIESMRNGLKKLGFYDVEETAIGATMVKNEYERILAEDNRDILISSCCHSINLLIQKHFPNELEYLADVLSPMQAHCQDIKKRYPNAKTVFIGPCVAKKDEAHNYEFLVDAVLTYEELSLMLNEKNIVLEKELDKNENTKARFFPTTGGILKTMAQNKEGYTYVSVDGVQNCIEVLKNIEEGKIHKCFIEMSACVGSCIAGPVMEKNNHSVVRDYIDIANYAGTKDFDVVQPETFSLRKHFSTYKLNNVMPSEHEISSVLRQMGKKTKLDELNCGSCGYETCRDKAIAICQGKAEISMCLPYLKDKAENFSDTIVKNIPLGLIVLNEKLEVQEINLAAKKIMNIRYASDVLGESVVRLLDPKLFIKTLETKLGVRDEKVYLPDYDKYVEQTVIYDRDSRLLIGILRDITSEVLERERKEELNRKTVEVADKVIDNQMRIVQEIASLLGETAAETKIALIKLKESIKNE